MFTSGRGRGVSGGVVAARRRLGDALVAAVAGGVAVAVENVHLWPILLISFGQKFYG
jgi:hypothetical protein